MRLSRMARILSFCYSMLSDRQIQLVFVHVFLVVVLLVLSLLAAAVAVVIRRCMQVKPISLFILFSPPVM